MKVGSVMFVFRLDARSGVPPYLQMVQQVRQAVLLGHLREGDQLPLIREAVEQLAINPNTVSKAYRQLEQEGLVTAKPGVGTFITGAPRSTVSAARYASLRRGFERWLGQAREACLHPPPGASPCLVRMLRRTRPMRSPTWGSSPRSTRSTAGSGCGSCCRCAVRSTRVGTRISP